MSRTRVPNDLLLSDVGRANQLVNGGFENWQRGNGPFTVNGFYHADRWNCSLAGTDALSITKDNTNVDVGSFTAAAVVFTLGTGAGQTDIRQSFKTTEGVLPRGVTLSVSARIRIAIPNAVRLGIYVDGTGGTQPFSAFHPGDGTYRTLTVSVPVPFDATVAILIIRFAASCTAYIDNVSMVTGSVAADYVPIYLADDLARCFRYYESIGQPASGDILVAGLPAASASGFMRTMMPFKAQKAIPPTVTKLGTWTVVNCGQPAIGASSVWSFFAQVIATTMDLDTYAINTPAGTYITAEANP